MNLCDMCGKETDLVVTLIESTELSVCNGCAKFGKVIRKLKQEEPVRKHHKTIEKKEPKEEIIKKIVKGYGKLIKNARERLDLKQDEFSKKINEKTSLMQKVESEHHEPSINLAKKIEKFLKIGLVEEEKLEKLSFDTSNSGNLTIGDIIKLKKD